MRNLVLFGLLVSLFSVVSPASAELPEGEVIEKGLPMPDGIVELYCKGESIYGVFELDGARIFLQTRRGEMIPEEVREADPTAPQYEIDVRLMSEDGFQFLTLSGGHSPIEVEWRHALEEMPSVERKALAARDFEAALEMVLRMENAKARADFEPEMRTITGLRTILERATIPIGIREPEKVSDMNAKACDHRWQIEVYQKDAYFDGFPAKHTGTVLWDIDPSWSATQLWIACNHGTCPGVSPMTYLCGYLTSASKCSCPSLPMCSTSFGIFPGQHVCNDDTYMQYYRVRYNILLSSTGGTCSDSSLRTSFSCW
jgi:hypothetical protein